MMQHNILYSIKLRFHITLLLISITTVVSAQTCVCAPCACYWYVSQGYNCSITNQTACLASLCNADFEKCRIACGCAAKGSSGSSDGSSTSSAKGPFQKNPGDVSIDGMSQGVPFFTPHQSSAFEDWSKDYKAQLESYGIKSILGNKITPHSKPLTDDPNWDDKYKKQADDFLKNPNPPPQPQTKSAPTDNISKTPMMFGTSEEKEKAYSKVPLYNDYLNKPPLDNTINENTHAADVTIFDKVLDKMASYFPEAPGIQIGVLIAKGIEQAAYSLIDDTSQNLVNAPSAILNSDPSALKEPDQMVSDAAKTGVKTVATLWYNEAKGMVKGSVKSYINSNGGVQVSQPNDNPSLPTYGGQNSGFRLITEH